MVGWLLSLRICVEIPGKYQLAARVIGESKVRYKQIRDWFFHNTLLKIQKQRVAFETNALFFLKQRVAFRIQRVAL